MTPSVSTISTQESTIVSLMKNYASYNLWANTTLINWLRTKDESVLEKEIPSSFAGIKPTLIHIWQTERYWLSILKREAPEEYTDYSGTLEDAFNGLLEQSTAVADFVHSLREEEIEEVTVIVSPWFQSDFKNLEYIMHCCNHSTYHRGQVITIGRNLGFTDAPMTDYNFYNVMGK